MGGGDSSVAGRQQSPRRILMIDILNSPSSGTLAVAIDAAVKGTAFLVLALVVHAVLGHRPE
jgi:hypothetical protein